jgi:hypothetical protein
MPHASVIGPFDFPPFIAFSSIAIVIEGHGLLQKVSVGPVARVKSLYVFASLCNLVLIALIQAELVDGVSVPPKSIP